jgi:hypothetical protein
MGCAQCTADSEGGMSQLLDDLKAARTLIDTPDYNFAVHGFHNAMLQLPVKRYARVRAALREVLGLPKTFKGLIPTLSALTYSQIVALFDRAIEAAAVDHAMETMKSMEGV